MADIIRNTFKSLGESKYGGVYVMCAIAIFKGILRPIFTMMDKKSDPETKKYAAIREGLTEVAALPLYATLPILLEKVVEKAFKGRPNLDKLKGNAQFLGLGIATIVIPAVCNIIQPPIMNKYKKYQESKQAQVGEGLQSKSVATLNKPLKTTFQGSYNHGMKVGG